MVTISFTHLQHLDNQVKFSCSPLFELAASLHVLASSSVEERHRQWVAQTLRSLSVEHLTEEWSYFAPVFANRIPWMLHPDKTKGITDSEELYEYIVQIPLGLFRQSFSFALHGNQIIEVKNPLPIEIDLQNDPNFVRGRFILFLSTYWEIIFLFTWQLIKPQLSREIEKITNASTSHDQFQAFLQSIPLPGVQEDPDGNQPTCEIQSLHLYPSIFFSGQPAMHMNADTGHLLYNIHDRVMPQP